MTDKLALKERTAKAREHARKLMTERKAGPLQAAIVAESIYNLPPGTLKRKERAKK